MRYTPVELRHVQLSRSLFGYRRRDVDSLLDDVADSYEEVWRERGELTDRLEDVEKRLGEFKDREQLLASTLVSAEKAAADAKDAARREAELIVAEANGEARSIVRAAQGERERLFGEARRVEALLRAALGMVEETKGDQIELREGEHSEPWPLHEDTSEFEAILSPGAAAAIRESEPGPADEPPEHAEPEDRREEQSEEDAEGRVSLPPVTEDEDDARPWGAD
jgi:cell division initiation protein